MRAVYSAAALWWASWGLLRPASWRRTLGLVHNSQEISAPHVVLYGSWRVTDGSWRVTDGSWRVTEGSWRVTDGSWRVTDVGWEVPMAVGGVTSGKRYFRFFILYSCPDGPPGAKRSDPCPHTRWWEAKSGMHSTRSHGGVSVCFWAPTPAAMGVGGGECHQGPVHVPVGTSGCMRWFGVWGGGCHYHLSADGGGNVCLGLRVGQSSLCSPVLPSSPSRRPLHWRRGGAAFIGRTAERLVFVFFWYLESLFQIKFRFPV